MESTETATQLRSRRRRATTSDAMAKKRRVKGATEQRKITLPAHVWGFLEDTAKLHTEAYLVMPSGGATQVTVSDLLESAAEMFLLSLHEDLGPLPTAKSSKAEREAWVRRLAEQIHKDILETYFSKKSH